MSAVPSPRRRRRIRRRPAPQHGIFAAFVLATLAIVIRVAGGKRDRRAVLRCGRVLSRQNGIAIAGDICRRPPSFGIAGAIALCRHGRLPSI